jgi:hypothetical protein
MVLLKALCFDHGGHVEHILGQPLAKLELELLPFRVCTVIVQDDKYGQDVGLVRSIEFSQSCTPAMLPLVADDAKYKEVAWQH